MFTINPWFTGIDYLLYQLTFGKYSMALAKSFWRDINHPIRCNNRAWAESIGVSTIFFVIQISIIIQLIAVPVGTDEVSRKIHNYASIKHPVRALG